MPTIEIDCYTYQGRPWVRIVRHRRDIVRYYEPTRASLRRLAFHVVVHRFVLQPWQTTVGWTATLEGDAS